MIAKSRFSRDNKLKLVGAPHIDFFECETLLLPVVTLHSRLHRSSNSFSLQYVADRYEKVVVVIERYSVSVTKLILKTLYVCY